MRNYFQGMACLIAQGGGLDGARFELRTGMNRVGRADDNDVYIAHPSVSGHHCEIKITPHAVEIKDLGSTNGTFLGMMKIQGGVLTHGQAVRLGEVPMMFFADHSGSSSAVSIPSGSVPTQAIPEVAIPTFHTTQIMAGADDCQNHAGTPATYACRGCQRQLCTECVKVLSFRGKKHFSCPSCSGACVTLDEARLLSGKHNKSVASSIGDAFVYPFRGNGTLQLITGTVFFGIMGWISTPSRAAFIIPGRLVVGIIATGYLFSTLQNIITSTSNGEKNPPPFPEFTNYQDDILTPCFQYGMIYALCLVPGFVVMAFVSPPAGLALLALGFFCLPMAILSVAMAGTISALNPMVIFPSIMKVLGDYLIACVVLFVVIAMVWGIRIMLEMMHIPVATGFVAGLVGFYGLFVEMRLLGMLYLVNKKRLAWF